MDTHLVLIEVDEKTGTILGATNADEMRETAGALDAAIELYCIENDLDPEGDADQDTALMALEQDSSRSLMEEDAFNLVKTLVERIDKDKADRESQKLLDKL